MIHRYLTLGEIADAMGVSRAWLYNNHARLEREHGFPGPAPGFGARRDATAVEAWQRRTMPAELQPKSGQLDVAEWREELDRRAEQLT